MSKSKSKIKTYATGFILIFLAWLPGPTSTRNCSNLTNFRGNPST